MTRPRIDAVLVQAVIAGALSFAHLHDIAEAAGQDGWKAWAYPISVDLLLVAAWHRIHTARANGTSTVTAWVWFIIALAASLGANVATAGLLDLADVPNWLRITVAGWPALAFFGGTLLAHTPPAASQTPATPPASTDPATVIERETPAPTAAADAAPPLPAPPAADPDPVAEMSPVPPALLEHARKIAATHREQTGTPIDTGTLRARLGVPEPMAAAIHTQLT